MRVIKIIGLVFGLFIMLGVLQSAYEISYRLIFGKTSYSTEAVFKVPQSTVEIVLERRCIHLFLAEYERTLVLQADGKEVLRQKAADDSGGYSRMNVFQVSSTEYFLRGEMDFDKHELDIKRLKINSGSLLENPTSTKFVGAFDSDEKREWRFISADERSEQPNKLEKYKQYR